MKLNELQHLEQSSFVSTEEEKKPRRHRYWIPGQLDRAYRMHEVIDECLAHQPKKKRIRLVAEMIGMDSYSSISGALYANGTIGNGKVLFDEETGKDAVDEDGYTITALGPDRTMALALCAVFNVNIEWLWDGVGEKYQQRVKFYDTLMKMGAHELLDKYISEHNDKVLEEYNSLQNSFDTDPTYRAARLNEELKLKFDHHLDGIYGSIDRTRGVIAQHIEAITLLFSEGAERQARIITHVLLINNVHESSIKELDLPLIDELKQNPALATQFFNEVQGIYNCLESYPTLIQAPEFLIVETRNYVREALKNMPIDLDRFFAQVPMDELQKLYLNKATPDDLISLLILGQTA